MPDDRYSFGGDRYGWSQEDRAKSDVLDIIESNPSEIGCPIDDLVEALHSDRPSAVRFLRRIEDDGDLMFVADDRVTSLRPIVS